jgi:hypothetical protein
MKRGKRLNAVSKTRKRIGKDPAYLAKVAALPCFVDNEHSGPIHAHHAIHRSQGGVDIDAVPLCHGCHDEWHTASGFFRDMDKAERKRFAHGMIALTRDRLGVRSDVEEMP